MTTSRTLRQLLPVLCLSLFAATELQAAPLFAVQQLPFAARDVNDTGQVVGNLGGQAALLTNGVVTTLGAGPALAINNNGEVLGSNWLWRPGLGRTTPGFSNAVAFNNVGQVVGRDQPFGSGAYIWNPNTGQQQIGIVYQGSGPPETGSFDVWDVNDAGEVALNFDLWPLPSGSVFGGGGIWRSATDTVPWQELPGECCGSAAWDGQVNNSGFGAGIALLARSPLLEPELPPGLDPSEFVCPQGCGGLLLMGPDGQAQYVALLGWNDYFGQLNDLNDLNAMVGEAGRYSVLGSGQRNYSFETAAFIASPDFGLKYLDELIDPAMGLPQGVKLVDALALNNRNQVIALGSDGGSYLLTPVPGPATVWLLSTALGGLVWAGRTRPA
jgi:hypothetical protein